MISWDRRDFKKLFPAILRELEESESSQLEEPEPTINEEPLRGFMPGPEDYIKRCTTDEEALNVIAFLKERGEITEEEFEKFRRQICETGVRSFGPLRQEGYYLKTYFRLGTRRSPGPKEQLDTG